ncbi:methyltransferase domain-containing protein [Actinoplanes sp. L3-i22]|uniref:methyltransferase domain-containing protein n=1 Tax=Actinoplanes sp. L3-i22 TaxID=2836373 RepID=UPI001C772CA9|nr:methyltransferase domain-containing protein [Actinoplanes sp. L3-i22]BCY09070.1 hypothetical protein L3i22_041580 [Actinoplanes sp. L3-i22]
MIGEPGLTTGAAGGSAAQLFNASIAAFAVVAADEIGLLAAAGRGDPVDLSTFAKQEDLHEPSVRAVATALAGAGVLVIDCDLAEPGPAFAEVHATKGFFTWLLGGCGELLRTTGAVSRNAGRTGRFITRDARAIAEGCGDFGARFIDPVFDQAFGGRRFRCVADLGCGAGARLIRALRADPRATGIGVDLAPAAVAEARERLAEAGLADRAVVIEADVHDLPRHPQFQRVDFVTSFLMGHDFWPRDRCRQVLRGLRRAFPAATDFALCDTYRAEQPAGADLPILTLGFEYVHALMGQQIPTLAEWRAVLPDSGWRIAHEHPLRLPPQSVIFHLVPDGSEGDR